VGTLLHGQYEVGRVLGQGGFGITYLGWDRQLGAAVCIKEYFPSHAVSRDCTVSNLVRCHTEAGAESFRLSKERFLREGRVLARFRDIPEIVSVYGSFEENDTVYIVMEYIKGMDLAHYVNHRGGRLSGEETFKILKPVMEALAQVHRSELVHRDIAPDNIMLHPRGGAKLLDFGAVRNVEGAEAGVDMAHSTEAILKHGFAPAEQYKSRGGLGPWSDEYAMCATVYCCLTGRIPPQAVERMLEDVEVSFDIPGLPAHQRQALEKGMAIRYKDRHGSM
jgi:serine/threonine protein kinase